MSPRKKSVVLEEFKAVLDELDSAIKTGRAEVARAKLEEISKKKLPRDYVVQVAALARRAEIPDTALRVLGPIVRPARPLAHPATPNETAEYAACLVKIGATTEAFNLLAKIDPRTCPSSLLYKAFAHIAMWDYTASIPLLEAYIAHPEADEYLHFVSRVNLASSLTYERRHNEALLLIDALLNETKSKGFTLLHGNLLELRAQNAIQSSEWEEAEESLAAAEAALAETGARFGLFVRKWRTFYELLRKGEDPKVLLELKRVRKEAESHRHWETQRDCDRVMALVTHDKKLATRLFFGTPFESFRKKLAKDWGERLELPENYEWHGPGKGGPELDLIRGQLEGAKDPLRPGGIIHRFLLTLTSDFYRSQRLACLFAALYPGEFYSPSLAASRLHQASNRLRTWFEKNKLPLALSEAGGFYRLELTGPIKIVVGRPDQAAESPQVLLLREKLGGAEQWFNVRDAAKVLDTSARSALRLLNELREANAIERQGTGNKMQYRFVQRAAKGVQAA